MEIIPYRSHTRQTAFRYAWMAAGLFALILLIAVVSRRIVSLPAVSGILALISLFALVAFRDGVLPRLDRWATGHMGERRVLSLLRDLPDSYVAVTNFVVPGEERGDIDLILIGPMGMVAVEIKTYAGSILYENGRWWKRQPNGWKTPLRKNLSGQARGHKKSLLAYLQTQREQHIGLANVPLVVEPILVFVGVDELQTEGLAIPAVRAKDLADLIRTLPTCFTPDQVSAIRAVFRTTGQDNDGKFATYANETAVLNPTHTGTAAEFAPSLSAPIAERPLCPKCGVPMVLRTARRGQDAGKAFYGCSNYPKCRQTRAV